MVFSEALKGRVRLMGADHAALIRPTGFFGVCSLFAS